MTPPLPMEGMLPPDLQGTLVRIGPGLGGGALHAVELRDGAAVGYAQCASSADANVLWHGGAVLALAETGLPQRFSLGLEPESFGGGLRQPVASHVHRDAQSGGRVLFAVEPGVRDWAGDGSGETGPVLRLGEWDAAGSLVGHGAVPLERATWQHDMAVTGETVVFVESPTAYFEELAAGGAPVPFRWTPGAESWIGLVGRGGDWPVEWVRLDPCLVTHVLGAHEEDGGVVMVVVRYPVPESGQHFDLESSVVGAAGIGASLIGGGLGVLERWRVAGGRCEQEPMDDRFVEYVQGDPLSEGEVLRHCYGVELAEDVTDGVVPRGLLQYDLGRGEVRAWSPTAHGLPSEPLFVRGAEGRGSDEGWLLSVVQDRVEGVSDLYVLDASSFGPRSVPLAVIHLPEVLPFRSHGVWIGADTYR